MDGEELFPTTAGVPQGGPISPLLANVALHGLETALTTAFPKKITQSGRRINWQPKVIVYADDFVILHRNPEVIQKAQVIATQWLNEIGLTLNDNKTRITHTLNPYQGNVGFDFLGFQIRQYRVGKSHSGKDARGNLLGFKTIIQPSTRSIHRHSSTIGKIIRKHQAASQAALIANLNPIIKGWTQYYAPVASKGSSEDCPTSPTKNSLAGQNDATRIKPERSSSPNTGAWKLDIGSSRPNRDTSSIDTIGHPLFAMSKSKEIEALTMVTGRTGLLDKNGTLNSLKELPRSFTNKKGNAQNAD